MLELGEDAAEEHARIGADARAAEDRLSPHVRTHWRAISLVAREMPRAMHYDQKNMLSEYLLELIAPGDAVLVKGSRGMKMEDVVTFSGAYA